MTVAGSHNSSKSDVNSGITGMDRGCRFRLSLQSLGALRSYLGAQGPLDMME